MHSTNSSTPPQTGTQHSPHQWTAPNYGYTAPHLAYPTVDSPALNPDESRNFQQVVETFLYYKRAVNPEMIVALNTIASEQPKITHGTSKKVVQLLKYAATHPEAITRYYASGMNLHIHSNGSFLLATEYSNRAGGCHYLS